MNYELEKTNGSEDILSEILERDDKVSHDPGNRPASLNDNQKRYLINLGPHQPRLSSYPINDEMKSKRDRCCFQPGWFEE